MLSNPSDERLEAGDRPTSPWAGLPEPASANTVAKLIRLDEGLYAFTVPDEPVTSGIAAGFGVPAVHISAPPQCSQPMEIVDTRGRAAEWIAAGQKTLFVRAPVGGGIALVTAYPARDPKSRPIQLEIRRLDQVGFAAAVAKSAATSDAELAGQSPFARVFLADPISVVAEAEPLPIEILLHIRRRGDLGFVDAPWAGRLGPGLWIESFTILPQQRSAAAIEYKGLTAAGVETEWLSCGSACGSRGMDTPLVGFAVRQKLGAEDGALDCEYSGYFQSGAIVGPCRNGAPCLSATANDPLEGIQLRILARRRPAGSDNQPSR
jgi:hypothetical protein